MNRAYKIVSGAANGWDSCIDPQIEYKTIVRFGIDGAELEHEIIIHIGRLGLGLVVNGEITDTYLLKVIC